MAERVRDTAPAKDPKLLGRSAGRMLGLATAMSLLGTTGEAGLLHFRGAFQNPAMFLPVTLPPAAAALMAKAALGDAHKQRPFTRFWLGLTSVMGVAGVGFHIFWGFARDGRVAELAAEYGGRPADPGTAEFCWIGPGRPCVFGADARAP